MAKPASFGTNRSSPEEDKAQESTSEPGARFADRRSRDGDSAPHLETVTRNTRVSLDLKSEKLSYIFEMLTELHQLSATLDEPMVAYLIEMAVLETNTAINVLDFNVDSDREKRSFETQRSVSSAKG